MDKIDKILFNYLWDNRPHKIAKDVVSSEYQFGGIKMLNIYIKNDALNAPGWIKSTKTQAVLYVQP